ncbi:hypothetical protein GCM10010254_62340 [Streptomyces chromofuscus]|nr:hypothetical protein GCM10010254_62340 [Streptomyces chromofuscus]
MDSARARLRYGEWLRREQRRAEARSHLSEAHEMLGAAGAEAFAERARRELQAAGVKVRKQAAPTSAVLTAKEVEIARRAPVASRAGRSPPDCSSAATQSNAVAQGLREAGHLLPQGDRLDATRRRGDDVLTLLTGTDQHRRLPAT